MRTKGEKGESGDHPAIRRWDPKEMVKEGASREASAGNGGKRGSAEALGMLGKGSALKEGHLGVARRTGRVARLTRLLTRRARTLARGR